MKPYALFTDPRPYETANSIWTHPHIAREMLKAHLDDSNDAASYTSSRRARIVEHLMRALDLRPGNRLLDLGCGPGLYAEAFAQKGLRAVGIDQSENSIAYARENAAKRAESAEYALGNYCERLPSGPFDAAVMISKDYGVLSPENRALLLSNIHHALKPGAHFALDLVSENEALESTLTWQAEPSGFFRPHPHVLLSKRCFYPEHYAYCDVHIVIDDEITPYYTHQTLYTPKRITEELEAAGFRVESLFDNLDGAAYTGKNREFALIAKRL